MNILFICTSNKDRSPALEAYFRETYSKNQYRSAGVNLYFTSKNKTRYVSLEDIEWANLIVYAEKIHQEVIHKNFYSEIRSVFKDELVLSLGDYKKGEINDDYLMGAELKLEQYLKIYE